MTLAIVGASLEDDDGPAADAVDAELPTADDPELDDDNDPPAC